MGKKDTLTKEYMSKPQYFADAFNSSVFGGEQIVRADSLALQEMDPNELGIIISDDEKEFFQKARDVLKKSVVMKDGNVTYLLLGIENQSEVHYAMPVRNLVYDALNYGRQVQNIASKHRKQKDLRDAEFLSGFSKTDKIMPVITLTVYFGGDDWDAPRCLKDMFPPGIDEKILNEVDDYKLHLIIPKEIEDYSLFKTDFGKAMRYIAASENLEKIKEISSDVAFEAVSVDTVIFINEYTNNKIEIPTGEEVVNMSKGLDDYAEEKKKEGIMETLVDLVQKGLLAVKDAAAQAGMSVEEFQKIVQYK